MYSLTNLFAEQMRRQELLDEALREHALREVSGDPRASHQLLYALGKGLSKAGERLQARYGQVAVRARSSRSEVSYRFN